MLMGSVNLFSTLLVLSLLEIALAGGGGSPPPPPPPCQWTGWSAWSGSCDQTSSRTCTAVNPCTGSSPCSSGAAGSRTRSLWTAGSLGGWTNWGSWSTSCGSGSRTRTRSCIPTSSCNAGCGASPLSESQSNSLIGAYAYWNSWSAWSPSCGSRTRSRSCVAGCGYSAANCAGANSQSSTTCCPVNGGWSAWLIGGWSSSCGSASRTNTRSCTNPAPSCGGAACGGVSISTDSTCCINAVNGVWSGWSPWSGTCVTSGATVTRTRSCSAACGGSACAGSPSESLAFPSVACCPVAGSWSAWSNWGSWTTSCGSGTRTKTRTCNPAPYCNAGCSGSNSATESSTSIGAYTSWSSWSGWAPTCGSQSSARTCGQFCGSTGTCAGASSRSQTTCCPVAGGWTSWSIGAWSGSCGSVTRTNTRACTNPSASCGGAACVGVTSVLESNCCLNAFNGAWSLWGTWSASCVTQTGAITRSRTCSTTCGGTPCPGSATDSLTLATGATCCLIDASWSVWSSWTTWSTTCGDGSATRTRTCSYPAGTDSRCYGATCPGSATDSKSRTAYLAVAGGWTAWGPYDLTCSTRTRLRTCSNPVPSCGGVTCAGSSSDSRTDCCPVNGGWTSWGTWTSWSGACSTSQARSRTRTCSQPAPSCMGATCPGSSQASDTKPVHQNCCAGSWGRSSDNTCQACTVCGTGLTTMTPCATFADTICRDITPPVVTLNPPAVQFLQAGTIWVDPGATATDSRDGSLTVVRIPAAPNNMLLAMQTINYTATDAAGNVGFAVRQINVSDTLPPTLTLNGASVVSCEAATIYVDLGCTSIDLFDGNLTSSIVVSGLPINTLIIGSKTLTYTSCDLRTPPRCASITRTVNVVQTIVPVITLLGSAAMTVEATTTWTDPGATASDTLDPNLSPNITRMVFSPSNAIVGSVNTWVVGLYRIFYNVRNVNGLNATAALRTVTVRDTIVPIITLLGANPLSHQGATVYAEPGYTAIDTLDGTITGNVVVTGQNFNIMAPAGSRFNITYMVTDANGNAAIPRTRTINIIDTVAPRLFLIGNATVYHQGAVAYVDAGCFANDTLDGNITNRIQVTNPVNVMASAGTTFVVRYNVTDLAGNSATITRTVIIIDTIIPIITLNGGNMDWQGATPFLDPGARASDTLDGNITSAIIRTGNVNVMAAAGSQFTLTYNVRDAAGNNATTRTRLVTIIDTIPPVIYITGNTTYYQEGAFSYFDQGATANDTLSGDLTSSIVTVNPVNVFSAAGTRFNVTYNVQDPAGNHAAQRQRTVVIIDTIAPNLTLVGPSSMEWQGATAWQDPGATAVDLLDGDITTRIVVGGPAVDTMQPAGTLFVVTYNVQDLAGNWAVQLTRNVTIIDTIAPVIQLDGQAVMDHEAAWLWVDPGFTAEDLLDGNLTANITINGVVDVMAVSGSVFELSYHVHDRAGNFAIPKSRNVTVIDRIKPNITLFGNETVLHEAATAWVDPGYEAEDLLDGDLTANVTIGGTVNVMAASGTFVMLTYNVADRAGNAADQKIREVVNLDRTKPVITLRGSALLLHQGATTFVDPGVEAWDTLNGNITSWVTVQGVVDTMAAPETNFTLVYRVADAAGNQAEPVERIVRIIDTIAPQVFVTGSATRRVEGGVTYMDLGAKANDTLDGDVTVDIVAEVTLALPVGGGLVSPLSPVSPALSGSLDIINTYCPIGSVYTINYTVTDRAGNRGYATRTLTLVDTLPPSVHVLGSRFVLTRQNGPYIDAGAVAHDLYFGDLTSNIEMIITPSVALVNLTAGVGDYTISYSVRDPSDNVRVEDGRMVRVLVGEALAIQDTANAVVTVALNLNLSTPAVDKPAVAFRASFVSVEGFNATQTLLSVGIRPTVIECTGPSDFLQCIFEAPLVTSNQLARLRTSSAAAAVSYFPQPVTLYSGAFSTEPATTPTVANAEALLAAINIQPVTVSCADTVCSFTTRTRPPGMGSSYTPPASEQRRRRGVANIGSLRLGAELGPTMKRMFTLVLPQQNITFDAETLLEGMNLIGISPSTLRCELNMCEVRTYDPLVPSRMAALKALLPADAILSPVTMFTKINATLVLSQALGQQQVLFGLLATGLGVEALDCSSSQSQTQTQCTFTTYSDISPNAQTAIRNALPVINISLGLESSSPQPTLPDKLKGSFSIFQSSNFLDVFQHANITNYTDLTCISSLTYDNAIDCSYFVDAPLTDDQVFAIVNMTIVLAATKPQNMTMYSAMRDALRVSLVEALGVPTSRFLISSIDLTSGRIQIYLLPEGSTSQASSQWRGSFSVCGMASISQANATELIASCGIDTIEVVVSNGTQVSFLARNASSSATQCLQSQQRVCNSSMTPLEWIGASLTASELSAMLVGLADDSLFTVQVSNRIFWAVPGMTEAAVAPQASSSSGSSGSFLVLAGGAGAALLVGIALLLLLLTYRRRWKAAAAARNNNNLGVGQTLTLRRPSLAASQIRPNRQSFGTTNPLFIETMDEPDYLDCHPEDAYQELHAYDESMGMQFNNPLYDERKEDPYDQQRSPAASGQDDEYLNGYDFISPVSSTGAVAAAYDYAAGGAPVNQYEAVDRRHKGYADRHAYAAAGESPYAGIRGQDALGNETYLETQEGAAHEHYLPVQQLSVKPDRDYMTVEPSGHDEDAYGFGGGVQDVDIYGFAPDEPYVAPE
eukprot:m.185510 g.185510  ORF g.185510 m.185510 type:complete len:2671 (+) comp15398_c0_seq5:162-8174(+)